MRTPSIGAIYQGRSIELNRPKYAPKGAKKFFVYVRNPETQQVKKVNFGQRGSRIKKDNPERRQSFRARHKCNEANDITSARYWSCRMW